MIEGICRICHARVLLNKSTGRVRKHINKYYQMPCQGAGKLPSAVEKLKQGE